MRLIVLAPIALAAAATGCFAPERVGRPPSADEVGRIDQSTFAGRGLVVEYAATPVEKLTGEPVNLASADDHGYTFNLRDGRAQTLPLEAVRGLEVKGGSRAQGAVIGAAIGAGAELAVLAAVLAVISGLPPEDPSAPPPPDSGCTAKCVGFVALIGLEGALMGGLLGALIAGPRRFEFAAEPAPSP